MATCQITITRAGRAPCGTVTGGMLRGQAACAPAVASGPVFTHPPAGKRADLSLSRVPINRPVQRARSLVHTHSRTREAARCSAEPDMPSCARVHKWRGGRRRGHRKPIG